MRNIYEEAKIEVIEFECKDILTTSDPAFIPGMGDQDDNDGGDIKLPEIKF